MIALDIATLGGLRRLSPVESVVSGLPPESHGAFLFTKTDGSDWTLATTDMDFFALVLSAQIDVDLERVILRTGHFTSLVPGWPEYGVGEIADVPDPELLPRSD